MEQFPPILVRAFGERWFETGSLSCYFRNATIDNEAVRPIAQEPPRRADDAQVKIWMERDDGMQVLEGTASVGDAAPSRRCCGGSSPSRAKAVSGASSRELQRRRCTIEPVRTR